MIELQLFYELIKKNTHYQPHSLTFHKSEQVGIGMGDMTIILFHDASNLIF